MGDKYEIQVLVRGFDEEMNEYSYIHREYCSTWTEAYELLEKYSKKSNCVTLSVRTNKQGLI